MKLLIVASTQKEIAPTLNYLEEEATTIKAYQYKLKALHIDILITGVGIPDTLYSLMKYFQNNEADHLLNAGIAGAFDKSVDLGTVFLITRQRFADIGIQGSDGSFRDVYEEGLAEPNRPPFKDGWLNLPKAGIYGFLPKASSITVNKVLGEEKSIREIREKYDPDLESMEGAVVAFVCLRESIPWLEIRSVSNYIEARDKDKWDIPLAISQLNRTIQSMINSWSDISGDTPFPAQ